MNNLPVEVLQSILIRLDIPPSELLDKITLVCKTWRSAIMTDWFLSRFYARSSRMSSKDVYCMEAKEWHPSTRSSTTWHSSLTRSWSLLEREKPIHSTHLSSMAYLDTCSMYFFVHVVMVIIGMGSSLHSGSRVRPMFIGLNIETYMFELQADNVLFSSPDAPGTLPCETWVHVVFLCEQQQDEMTHCSAWIDGKQHEGTIHSTRPHRSKWVDIGHFGVYATEWSGPPYNCRLADLRLFPFLLTLPEIRAVAKQKTAIDKINMITHWKTKTQDNQSAHTTDLSRVNVGQLL